MGHLPTQLPRYAAAVRMYELYRVCCGSWVDAREEYSVQWAEYYEPYIVGAKSVMPEYDERFTGYGP